MSETRGLQREYLRGSGKGRACVVTPRSCFMASGRYRARSVEAQSGKAGKVHLWTGAGGRGRAVTGDLSKVGSVDWGSGGWVALGGERLGSPGLQQPLLHSSRLVCTFRFQLEAAEGGRACSWYVQSHL